MPRQIPRPVCSNNTGKRTRKYYSYCSQPYPLSECPALTYRQWQNIEKVAKGPIQERKIRVLYLPAEGLTTTPSQNHVNGNVGSQPLSRFESTNDHPSTLETKYHPLLMAHPHHHLGLPPQMPSLRRVALLQIPRVSEVQSRYTVLRHQILSPSSVRQLQVSPTPCRLLLKTCECNFLKPKPRF